MAPKFEETWMVVIEQGGTANAAINAMDGTIDNMTKTGVIFSLRTEFLGRNSWKTATY